MIHRRRVDERSGGGRSGDRESGNSTRRELSLTRGDDRPSTPVAEIQHALGNRGVQRLAGIDGGQIQVSEPGDRLEREANRVAEAVVASPTAGRAVGESDRSRRTDLTVVNGPLVQRQQEDRPEGGRPERPNGPEQQRPQQQPEQRQQPQQQQQPEREVQPQGEGNQEQGGGMDLSADQIREFTATVLSEAAPGREIENREETTRQEDDIKWVYYHLVQSQGFQTGLDRSAAHANESAGYRFWLTVLGADTYRDDQPPAWGDARENYETMGDYVDAISGNYDDRADYLEGEVEDLFEAPTEAEHEGFTGQGNEADLNGENGDSPYWQRARQYYRLQEGDADVDVDPAALETYVEVIEGQAPNNPQVIFDPESIREYFQQHPDHLPDDPPQVDL